MKLLKAGVAAIALFAAATGVAKAEVQENTWREVADYTYFKIEGGFVFGGEGELEGGGGFDFDYDNGWASSVAIGKAINEHIRIELEGAYQALDVPDLDGDISAYSLLANVFYDFESRHERLRPFIGAGIGVSFIEPDYDFLGNNADTTTAFSAQGTAGVFYDLSKDASLSLRYRYLYAGDYDAGFGFEDTLANHAVLAGLTIRFGAQNREICRQAYNRDVAEEVVFYGVDEDILTEDDKAQLDAIIAEYESRPAEDRAKITVDSHASTTASREYNQDLSERRAAAVVAYLNDNMSTSVARVRSEDVTAHGEENLPVPTADNVEEQGNRVSIVVVRIIVDEVVDC